jgi:DUF4097 and DUF4098 domain-containing protein YvlB
MKGTRSRPFALLAIAVSALLWTTALADSRLVRTILLDPGGKFILNSKVGSVTVTGTARSNVVVVITSKRDDLESKMTFEFEEEPGLVRVTAVEREQKKSFWGTMFNWRGDNVSFEYDIRVPFDTELEIDTNRGAVRVFDIRATVRLETNGGSIGVRDLRGAVLAETSGGDIILERIEGDIRIAAMGGKIRATDLDGPIFGRTTNGSIEVANVSGDVDVGAVGAPVTIEGAGGRVSARTTGGLLDVRFAAGNQSGGRLKANRGGVKVALDSGINLSVDAHADGGRVRTDLPIRLSADTTASRITGVLGSGGARLIVRSIGGSITLDPI